MLDVLLLPGPASSPSSFSPSSRELRLKPQEQGEPEFQEDCC
jgi:hypothetical protein